MAYSRFPTQRGRPRSTASRDSDYGTPELVYKRACGQTMEAIDLCHERGLISAQQHRAGLHFRWLYTLRYGSPHISAMDLLRASGQAAGEKDASQWRMDREAEYETAFAHLRARQLHAVVVDVCVHDLRPDFLCQQHWARAYANASLRHHLQQQMERFGQGLQLLAGLWYPHRSR